MGYIVLYFSIGAAFAILIYLYSCYDYRINFRDWSWDRYVDTNDIYEIIGVFLFLYPFMLLILACAGLWWCAEYAVEYVREWIFKTIDQHFVK
jgi:hypothetical protein